MPNFPCLKSSSVEQCAKLTSFQSLEGSGSHCLLSNRFLYLYKSNILEILVPPKCTPMTLYCFGRQHEYRCTIRCLDTLTLPRERPCPAVICSVYTPEVDTSFVCIVNVHRSTVETAVELPGDITAIKVVSDCAMEGTHPLLTRFSGCLAIGTKRGFTYLMDLCLTSPVRSDQSCPLKPQLIRMSDLAEIHDKDIDNKHVMFSLDDSILSWGNFLYKKTDGDIWGKINADDVNITCLQFISASNSLLVGFNFGCVQIWRLKDFTREYSMRYPQDLGGPVTSLAYQEPENDPRYYAYLWVGRQSKDTVSPCTVTLMQLGYRKKKIISSGCYYKTLSSVVECLTSPLPPLTSSSTQGSRLLSCRSLAIDRVVSSSSTTDDRGCQLATDLCRTTFVWCVGQRVFLGLFDLNRWYEAQMPASFQFTEQGNTCSYFVAYDFSDTMPAGVPLDIRIDEKSLRLFSDSSKEFPAEQFFFPSALNFSCYICTTSGLYTSQITAQQSLLLRRLSSGDTRLLCQAEEMVTMAVTLGLLPLTAVSCQQHFGWVFIDFLLEQECSSMLSNWMSGLVAQVELKGGPLRSITLEEALDWIWKRFLKIKTRFDQVTQVVFLPTPSPHLSPNQLYDLHRCISLATSLHRLLKQANSSEVLDRSVPEHLSAQVDCSNLFCQAARLLLWLYNYGFCADYDPAGLAKIYSRLRKEQGSELLLVDHLVEELGDDVNALWTSYGTGRYPPDTLQAVCDVFRTGELPMSVKHGLVFYLICDQAAAGSSASLESRQTLIRDMTTFYCSEFHVDIRLAKSAQLCWLIDQGFLEEVPRTMRNLTLPSLYHRQHWLLVQTLLNRGKVHLADRLFRQLSPNLVSSDDLVERARLLVYVDQLDEAVGLLEREESDEESMVDAIIDACVQEKRLSALLRYATSYHLEAALLAGLTRCGRHDLVALHWVKRSQYQRAWTMVQSTENPVSNITRDLVTAVVRALPKGSLSTDRSFLTGNQPYFLEPGQKRRRPKSPTLDATTPPKRFFLPPVQRKIKQTSIVKETPINKTTRSLRDHPIYSVLRTPPVAYPVFNMVAKVATPSSSSDIPLATINSILKSTAATLQHPSISLIGKETTHLEAKHSILKSTATSQQSPTYVTMDTERVPMSATDECMETSKLVKDSHSIDRREGSIFSLEKQTNEFDWQSKVNLEHPATSILSTNVRSGLQFDDQFTFSVPTPSTPVVQHPKIQQLSKFRAEFTFSPPSSRQINRINVEEPTHTVKFNLPSPEGSADYSIASLDESEDSNDNSVASLTESVEISGSNIAPLKESKESPTNEISPLTKSMGSTTNEISPLTKSMGSTTNEISPLTKSMGSSTNDIAPLMESPESSTKEVVSFIKSIDSAESIDDFEPPTISVEISPVKSKSSSEVVLATKGFDISTNVCISPTSEDTASSNNSVSSSRRDIETCEICSGGEESFTDVSSKPSPQLPSDSGPIEPDIEERETPLVSMAVEISPPEDSIEPEIEETDNVVMSKCGELRLSLSPVREESPTHEFEEASPPTVKPRDHSLQEISPPQGKSLLEDTDDLESVCSESTGLRRSSRRRTSVLHTLPIVTAPAKRGRRSRASSQSEDPVLPGPDSSIPNVSSADVTIAGCDDDLESVCSEVSESTGLRRSSRRRTSVIHTLPIVAAPAKRGRRSRASSQSEDPVLPGPDSNMPTGSSADVTLDGCQDDLESVCSEVSESTGLRRSSRRRTSVLHTLPIVTAPAKRGRRSRASSQSEDPVLPGPDSSIPNVSSADVTIAGFDDDLESVCSEVSESTGLRRSSRRRTSVLHTLPIVTAPAKRGRPKTSSVSEEPELPSDERTTGRSIRTRSAKNN